MHGETIGIGQTPTVAISYLGVGGLLFACARYAAPASRPAAADSGPHEAHVAEAAPATG